MNLVYQLSELESDIKSSTQKTILFQAGMIKLCNQQAENHKTIEDRIGKIEKYIKSGNYLPQEKMSNPIQTTTRRNEKVVNTPIGGMKNIVKESQTGKTIQTKNFSKNAEEYWPQIMNDLKQNGRIVLYTNLMGTKAKELNDMTVGIEFPNGITSFGKTVLEKQENIREITNLISIACGKEMQIKYLAQTPEQQLITKEENLQNFANESNIPFQIIE